MSIIAKARFQRFKSIKHGMLRGFLFALFVILLLAELVANNRALIVKDNDKYFFPT